MLISERQFHLPTPIFLRLALGTLGAGLFLDLIDLLFRTPGSFLVLPVLCFSLAMGLACGRTEIAAQIEKEIGGAVQRRRYFVEVLLWLTIAGFVVATYRYGGFKGSINSVFAAGDNSEWLRFSAEALTGKTSPHFGYGTALFQAVSNGLVVILLGIFGDRADSLQAVVASVWIQYVVLTLLMVLGCVSLARRQGLFAGPRKLNLLGFLALLFTLMVFGHEVANSGHFTAGASCGLLLLFLLHGVNDKYGDEHNVRFVSLIGAGLSCTLWMPLLPLGVCFCGYGTWLLLRQDLNRRRNLRKSWIWLNLVVGGGILGKGLIQLWHLGGLGFSLSGNRSSSFQSEMTASGALKLFELDGATFSTSVTSLVLILFLVVLGSLVGPDPGRFALLGLTGYAAAVVLSDLLLTGRLNYGSTKILWALSPVVVCVALVATWRWSEGPPSVARQWLARLSILCAMTLGLVAVAGDRPFVSPIYGGDTSTLRIPERVAAGIGLKRWDDKDAWNVSVPMLDSPSGCIGIRQDDYLSVAQVSEEAYRCSKVVGVIYSGASSDLVGGAEADYTWRALARGERNFAEVLFSTLEDTEFLQSNLLMVDEKGHVIGTQRWLDVAMAVTRR